MNRAAKASVSVVEQFSEKPPLNLVDSLRKGIPKQALEVPLHDLAERGIGGVIHLLVRHPLVGILVKTISTREAAALGITSVIVSVGEPGTLEKELASLPVRKEGTSASKLLLLVDGLSSALQQVLAGAKSDSASLPGFAHQVSTYLGKFATTESALVLVMWPLWVIESYGKDADALQLTGVVEVSPDPDLVNDIARELLKAYEGRWKVTLPPDSADEIAVAFLNGLDFKLDVIQAIAVRLDKWRSQGTSRPLTRADEALLVKVIDKLGTPDKRTYGEKRDLLGPLRALSGGDVVPFLVNRVEAELRRIETQFDQELKKSIQDFQLTLAGEYPSYRISSYASKQSFAVDVRVPYSYVLVDGDDVEGKYPKAIAEELNRRVQEAEKFVVRDIGSTDFVQIAHLAGGALMRTTGMNQVTVHDLLASIVLEFRLSKVRPAGSEGTPMIEWAQRNLRSEAVWRQLIEFGWRFESGKTGSLELEGSGGKQAVILVWEGGETHGFSNG